MDDKLSKPVRINELKALLQATDKIESADRPLSTSGSNLPVCDEGQWKEFLQVDDSGEFVTQVLELLLRKPDSWQAGCPIWQAIRRSLPRRRTN